MPMALILLVIASIIIMPGLWAMQSFMTINSNVEQDTMAYYAADAGVADCIWKYKYGTAPTATYQLTNINGMNVDCHAPAAEHIDEFLLAIECPVRFGTQSQDSVLDYADRHCRQ